MFLITLKIRHSYQNLKMHLYHERANAIRPYNNPKNPVNPDSKPGCKLLPKLKQRITKNSREIP